MRSEEELTRRAVWIAVFVAAVTVAQLVASRAVRDGFFLTHFDASDLPKIVVGSSILSVIVVLASSRLLRGIAPAQSVPWIFALSAFLFVIEWVLADYYPAIASILVYLHVVSIGLLVASGFWSVVNERFDPYTAKLSIGKIGSGATLGGVLGGVVAWGAAQRIDISTMILALAVVNVICAIGVKRLGQGSRPIHGSEENQEAALAILAGNPYLRNLMLLVILGAFCQACYDYVFKSSVAAVYTDGSELVSFFALFYMGLNIVTFLAQNLLTRRVLSTYGLSTTVGSLPGSGAVLGIIGLLFPGLTSAMAMRGGIGAVENSIFRSGYELLYTPVLPQQKRPTKTLIDVGGEMTGAVFGGAVAFVVLAFAPESANVLLILAGIGASVAGLYLVRRIRSGYVYSLTETLEAGNVDLEEAAFGAEQMALTPQAQPSLQQAFSESGFIPAKDLGGSATVIMRTDLQDYLENRRSSELAEKPRWKYAPLVQASPPTAEAVTSDPTITAIAHVHSGDAERIRRVITDFHPLPSQLIPALVRQLGREDIGAEVERALKYAGPLHLGALLDALADRDIDIAARRRLASLLGHIPTQRCVDNLLQSIDTLEPELRLRAASSLLRMRRSNLDLRYSRERIFELAEAEALICQQIWFARAALDPRISDTSALESVEGRRVVQGFTYISTLLLTVLDQQPAIHAARALAHSSSAKRGAGIEYLENVLPPKLLKALQPLLVDARLALGRATSRASILAEMED